MTYQDSSLRTPERVEDLISRMTLEEKVGQMVQADGRVDAEAQVQACSAGSFLHILGEKTFTLQRMAAETRLGIPIIFGIDAIHGHGFWPGSTVFPTQLSISSSWNRDHLVAMGRVTAAEMLATGLHWTFSPVLCLTRDLRWGRVGETFGEDHYLIGELAAALIAGYQGNDLSAEGSVAACAKHYAGYSETVGGRDATEADLSRRKLLSYFLPPFERAARSGCRTFMTAYQCIDGRACVVNEWLMDEVLRQTWGFEGVVVTDWDNVGRTYKQQMLYSSIADAIAPAVRAGNDIMMVTPEFYAGAIELVRSGALPEVLIDRAVRRVLALKFDLGLFDHKRFPKPDAVEVVGSPAHRRHLLPAALESVVLLKNGSRGGSPMLPLRAESLQRIAVLGPNADDTLAQLGDWSFGSGQAGLKTGGHPRETVTTILDGVRQRFAGEVTWARGCEVMTDDASAIEPAAELARRADVAIVVVGDVIEQIGEERDRSELDLTGGQMPLLQAVKATGTPLIVVLVNSKPLCIPWVAEHADAILEAWNPGMAGGEAVAQILFGDANPVGKLTVSFPRAIGDQPVYYNQIPGWHGSRHKNYDPTPLFAFGFGLSYTRYEYSGLTLDVTSAHVGRPRIRVSVEVANVGPRGGTEIVQLYVNDVFTSLSTPTKTLRGFRRVRLGVGERQNVEFELEATDLSFIDANGRRIVEPGEFEVMVGASSRDEDLQRARFTLVAD